MVFIPYDMDIKSHLDSSNEMKPIKVPDSQID
jgi:hypothetical protein